MRSRHTSNSSDTLPSRPVLPRLPRETHSPMLPASRLPQRARSRVESLESALPRVTTSPTSPSRREPLQLSHSRTFSSKRNQEREKPPRELRPHLLPHQRLRVAPRARARQLLSHLPRKPQLPRSHQLRVLRSERALTRSFTTHQASQLARRRPLRRVLLPPHHLLVRCPLLEPRNPPLVERRLLPQHTHHHLARSQPRPPIR